MDSEGRSGGRTWECDDTCTTPRSCWLPAACRFLGEVSDRWLAQNPLINHVIAVDAIAPEQATCCARMGRAEFVRADIRNPFIAKVIRNGDVDTVGCTPPRRPRAHRSGGARRRSKNLNVMGAIRLVRRHAEKAPSVRRVMLKSTSEVYGLEPRSIARVDVHRGRQAAERPLARGFARDSIDIEGYARGAGTGAGPTSRSPSCGCQHESARRWTPRFRGIWRAPVVPTVVGHDARLQLLHEQDALGALERATMAGKAGTFNVGALDIIMMSQAIQRAGPWSRCRAPRFALWC